MIVGHAAIVEATNAEDYAAAKALIEYRRMKRGTHIVRETTDYVAKEKTADNRIIPDAVFILENIETKNRALFFVEMDMATERIVSLITRDSRITL